MSTFFLFALLLCALPPECAAQAVESGSRSSTDVPVRKVVFFKSGVSYVEHRGRVTDTTTMTLRFQQDQMKDLLKSLVLQDRDGGQIGTIGYPSQDPLAKTLQSFQVDLTEPEGIGSFVNQLRGAEIELATADSAMTGQVVSAESRSGPDGAETWFLNLYAEGALRSVPLDRVQTLRFTDQKLQNEMRKALGAVAEARNTGKTPVELRFEGSGTRRVRIGYVVKAPVWKTSYRLLLPDDQEGTAQLQGWAIVENQTDADWENVDLTLVSGRPVSFVQDLYTPTYVDRPVVSPTSEHPLEPKQHEEGVSASSGRETETIESNMTGRGTKKTARAQSRALASAPSPSDRMQATEGVSAAATAAEEGAFFQYQVDDVSLARRRSALLPIVTETAEVERLSIYDPSLHETHPLKGARLKNTTDLHLAAGPLSVFDEGSYAGDARLSDTPPGDTRFLSYALNQNVQVDRGGQVTDQTVETGKIVQGVFRVSQRRVASRTYTLENEGTTDATVIVEHPRRSGWSLVSPSAEEQTPSTYRIRTTVDAGTTDELVVKQERIDAQKMRLVNTDRDRLLTYARTESLPDDVQDALQKATELQQALAQTESELKQAKERRQRFRDEQERVRENLGAVEPDTEYHDRLLDKLSATEDEIETLQSQIAALETKKTKKQDRLTSYLNDLNVQ